MRKLFERIVEFMEENGSIQSEYRDIYLFALQTVAVYAFNIGTGVVIGAAFGELLYCMIFLIAFMLLRQEAGGYHACLLYTSPSPRDGLLSRMPSSA